MVPDTSLESGPAWVVNRAERQLSGNKEARREDRSGSSRS
jgi:hypothetical protein